MWKQLLGRLRQVPSRGPDEYRRYTTKFDRVIRGDEINEFLDSRGQKGFEEYTTELDLALGRWRASAEIAAVEVTSASEFMHLQRDKPSVVASLLVDHSGSMRGQRAILATAIVEIVADLWSRLGIRYEILGFTTQSWHGGRARSKWKWAGRPPDPGRLCDLLHIIYRAADENKPGAPWAVRNLNRPALLKENVDGEAVDWAASRLLDRPETRRILIVISDGAPVDDSTLAANDDGYLLRHLLSVLKAVEAKGITVGAIGMGEFVESFYPRHVLINSPDDLSSLLIPFIVHMCSISD